MPVWSLLEWLQAFSQRVVSGCSSASRRRVACCSAATRQMYSDIEVSELAVSGVGVGVADLITTIGLGGIQLQVGAFDRLVEGFAQLHEG
jgi:hypothetical protein